MSSLFMPAMVNPARFVTKVILLACGTALLAGCTMDMTADSDLPPLRLSPPTVSAPVMVAAPVVYAPPVRAPAPVAPAEPGPAVESSDRAVPAAWIPKVPAGHWNWIIVHHSDSDYGSAAIIDKWHRARGFDELGYHFVIGNGTNSGDGQIEVGPRWPKQKWGAHDNALDNRYNIYGIGICLVGDFNKTRPTPKQMKSLETLIVYLMKTYHIPPERVLGHGETKDTECPGKYLHVADVRRAVTEMLAQGDQGTDGAVLAAERGKFGF